jgi:RNA polymerase sigma-70 factor (ECF subfamily)
MMPVRDRYQGEASGGDRDQWSSLMARAQSGDQHAYRRLLTEITPYVQALAARHHRESPDVEDTTQDVLLTVHAIRHTYDPARPFAPWLAAIAQRRIVDRLRKQGRTRSRETTLECPEETFAAPAANLAESGCDPRALRRAVERLPPGQRQAITMLKLEEMSLKEASMKTGMSVASLKVATHRGIRALRKLLMPRLDER